MVQKILELLQEINPYESIKEDTLLIEDGILDSVGVVTLVSLLEEEFEIEIPGEEMTPENFTTVAAVQKLALRCLHQRGSDHV